MEQVDILVSEVVGMKTLLSVWKTLAHPQSSIYARAPVADLEVLQGERKSDLVYKKKKVSIII